MKSFDNFDLKNASWVKIGGRAKKYFEVENSDELKIESTKLISNGEVFEVFGWGANTLFSDLGLSSTLIKAKSNELKIAVCANCHPFYTGKAKFIDAAGRVDKFQKKYNLK